MMIIDIDRLPEDGLEVSKDFEFFSSELVEENAVFLEPVHADVNVRRVGEEIFFSGRITTCLSFVCGRCLSPFEFKVDSAFDLVYFPEELEMVKDQLDDEDIKQMFFYSQKIDLKDIVLEQLNLAFPVRPLCTKDCQGICPVCGKIIREGDCSCAANELDPRLEKFKDFLRDKR
jgi:uncharacterized protein